MEDGLSGAHAMGSVADHPTASRLGTNSLVRCFDLKLATWVLQDTGLTMTFSDLAVKVS
jgi:hypothetical protein